VKHLLLACLLCFTPSTTPISVREINIHIAFGYKDARPARFVGDLFEKSYLVELLTRPCRSLTDNDCGYVRDQEDGDLLSRDLNAKNGDAYRVHLHITASSAGPDDEENRHDPFQAALSAIAEMNFLNGVAHADATFYVGHSRDGGGPDFRPPQLTKTQHVDYAWYRRTKTGFVKILSVLHQTRNNSRQRAPWLSLISCGSSKWFRAPIHNASPQMKLITVDSLIYYSDGLNHLLKIMADYLADRIPSNVPGTEKP